MLLQHTKIIRKVTYELLVENVVISWINEPARLDLLVLGLGLGV